MYQFAAVLLTMSLAFSYRIPTPGWIFGSVSLFDLTLIILSILMLPFFKFKIQDVTVMGMRQASAFNSQRIKERRLFLLLSLPLVVGVFSLSWAQNLIQPTKYLVSFAEAMLAYYFAVTVFTALAPNAAARAISGMVLLLLAGSLLSYLNAPGFDPEQIYFQNYQDDLQAAFLASYYSRLSHPFVGLSNAFASVLSFYLFLLWTYGRASGKNFYIFMAGLTFIAILATFSRGVIIAVVLAGLVFVKIQKVKIRLSIARLIVGVSLIGFLLAFLFLAPSGRDLVGYDLSVAASLESRMSIDNLEGRFEIIDYAWERIAERPLLGYGAGVKAGDSELLETTAHNAFIEQLLNYGIPLGLLLCVSFIFVMLYFFDVRHLSRQQAVVSKGVGIAVLSQLLVFFSQASFEGYLLKVIYYFSIGLGVVLVRKANSFSDGTSESK